MGAFLKILNIIFAVLAVIACLATVGVILYSVFWSNPTAEKEVISSQEAEQSVSGNIPDFDSAEMEAADKAQRHEHDYKESTEIKATCLSAGRLKYECECGDSYVVEMHAVGHKAGDWEVSVKATQTQAGTRVRKCIYCDELIASESYSWDGSSTEEEGHVHEYSASLESEATCTIAGVIKHTCSCGNYYTDYIPASGHLASEWIEIKAASTSDTGLRQRICNVCQTLIDSRVIDKVDPTPTPSGATPTPTPTPTATASPTPHSHDYQSYVSKEATCSTIGIKTYNCSCGADYSEQIDRDPNKHKYVTTVVKPTATTKGYTLYVCSYCNHSKKEDETAALGN